MFAHFWSMRNYLVVATIPARRCFLPHLKHEMSPVALPRPHQRPQGFYIFDGFAPPRPQGVLRSQARPYPDLVSLRLSIQRITSFACAVVCRALPTGGLPTTPTAIPLRV